MEERRFVESATFDLAFFFGDLTLACLPFLISVLSTGTMFICAEALDEEMFFKFLLVGLLTSVAVGSSVVELCVGAAF